MNRTFWKICTEAFEASKLGKLEDASYLCREADTVISALLPEDIDIIGRKKYLTSLMDHITNKKSNHNSFVSSLNPSNHSTSNLMFDVDALRDENNVLRKKLINKPSIDPLCIVDPSFQLEEGNKEEFGIVVFGHTRMESLEAILESLKRQDALQYTEVWLDGDQGNHELRTKVDLVIKLVSKYQVKYLHTQRGNYGFRKMMLLGLAGMSKKYEDILVLEDDCFPVNGAINEFRTELDSIRNNENIFSVYGHHFCVKGENDTFSRFQGWGWATTSSKMLPVLRQLIDCYSMPEKKYLEFVKTALTPEIRKKIEITPPRLPSYTLEKFFAWDETLCLLTAMNGQTHRPTKKRAIYNCGMGDNSTHFPNSSLWRQPPFNMIALNEVWDYF